MREAEDPTVLEEEHPIHLPQPMWELFQFLLASLHKDMPIGGQKEEENAARKNSKRAANQSNS